MSLSYLAPSYNRARYYDPAAGRFITEDPLGFSIGNNFYPYVLNNAINDIDPAGLWPDPYSLWKSGRRTVKKASCFLSFYSCADHLGETRDRLDSMSDDAIVNTATAQGNKGTLSNQRLSCGLAGDQNCKDTLERCLKLALTNPFPPPWWLSDLINYFSKNSFSPAPPLSRK